MRTRTRRGAAAVLAVSALCPTAAACGESGGSEGSGNKDFGDLAKRAGDTFVDAARG
ncbi:hypothetical protein [Streptomyces jumonjinensis]|uniref:hypothetical protein n=1 Tax=Streptomyces jumonjinensis TaxID=1945 RepID=UPI0037966A40